MTPADLKLWRAEHKYTQQTLAEALSVTRATVARWEVGMLGMPPFLALALERLAQRKPPNT